MASETRRLSLRDRAEQLWEGVGGDLCICQRPEVPHWCEKCQHRIDFIAMELADVLRSQEPPDHNRFRMDELDAVMLSVDKWFDEGDEALKNNPATRAAAAREIALQAIEQLQAKLGSREPVQAQITKRLREDASLKRANWDTYGAPPITRTALDAADQMHSRWQAVPSSDGGVTLEVHSNGYDVEISFGPKGEAAGGFMEIGDTPVSAERGT